MNSLAEAVDIIQLAEVFEGRLAAAATELAKQPTFVDEAAWLDAARRRIARARGAIGDLLTRALVLPELASLRAERSRALQGEVVDAIDGLQVAIATKIGERSPLIEAIHRNLKTPQMRRMGKADFEKQCAEIEKRLASSYVSRMLGDPDYAVLGPDLERYRTALSTWQSLSFDVAEDAQAPVRAELESTADAITTASRQARLLVEAAAVTAGAHFDATSLLEKPKRRAKRAEAAPSDDVPTTGDLFARDA